MILFAVSIGIYSYIIFALGLFSLLYPNIILSVSILYLIVIAFFKKNLLLSYIKNNGKISLKKLSINKITLFIITLFILQIIINLIGALGPELAIDALWYHLTLPKIYLISHKISHIPGTLFYYSDMPKLTEMIYTAILSFSNEIFVKLAHLSFGLLTCVVLYKISRKYFSQKSSLICIVIFYSSLVVGWESITAYIDLSRTFFEAMALWCYLNWVENNEKKWLIRLAVMSGFAISAKLLSLGSLLIFSVLIIYHLIKRKKQIKNFIIDLFFYWFISLLVSLPWFIFSYTNTGNPVYPFFTNLYKTEFDLNFLNPLNFIKDTWQIFVNSADPISPIYILFFPLTVLFLSKINKKIYPIIIYSIFAYLIWYFTPRSGGGRFIMPYLPAFSLVALATLNAVNIKFIKNLGIIMIFFSIIVSIFYRGTANARFLPVIMGKETKDDFLTQKLNFEFGNFYDTDGYFRNNIKSQDKVLLYGFHELYYIDFPFIDSSWIKIGDKFNYIAVQKGTIPNKFKDWKLIYKNPVTNVKLYSLGGKEWVY
ncbi:hypothetical protein C4559_00120 [Candidatus Microgenomates bacterium]|nr:MAG: hypothetical protein C4559_00120 [Candidatus Microgenomates bacterium]